MGLCALVVSGFMYYLLIIPAFLFYNLFFEVFNNGQTIGKRTLGLRVVTERGTTPSVEAYLTRWVFRLMDLGGSIGTIAMLFIMSTAKKQRIGDIMAQTLVIKTKGYQKIDLDQLENFYSTDREFHYPQIVQYNDEDMLLVKESLDRYKKYPNSNNRNLLHSIYDRIISDLDLDEKDFKNKTHFLEMILEEYILQTR